VTALVLAIAFAFAFALTNGFHDAANAIATLLATRGARPGQGIVLSAVFNVLGALLVGPRSRARSPESFRFRRLRRSR